MHGLPIELKDSVKPNILMQEPLQAGNRFVGLLVFHREGNLKFSLSQLVVLARRVKITCHNCVMCGNLLK
jgi:hypothetical protein